MNYPPWRFRGTPKILSRKVRIRLSPNSLKPTWVITSDLVNLAQPQHVSVKLKNVPLFDNVNTALTFTVFGVINKSWYLGTPTRRDLFISEVFLDTR